MDKLLYGAAYYEEYMPYDRLDEDIRMMKAAGLNVVRIAESTWSTEEPQEGVFDFSHVKRVLDAMEKNDMYVIVGTPTYAIPAWMAKKCPEVMVMDQTGHRRPYGARQIMDITNKDYRFYAERIIRKLMEAVSGYQCVIGFQLDNETKHYGTCSENVQAMFVEHMKKRFGGDLEELNRAFGLAYWSNRINTWEEFPSVVGTINGSLGCAFAKFQRSLVTEFIGAERAVVDEYRRPEQFVTHNFDFEWRGYTYGVQPDVDHKEVAKHLTIAGCDIYHPSQDALTGKEVGFGGDMARSLKNDNYYVMETQAQGFPQWTPYEGQLRLLAYSHLASGADGVMYWHWHSIHNACETYWKGILSHNLKENAVYREVGQVGREFAAIGGKLLHLKKHNKAAIMVSNEALSALWWFPLDPASQHRGDYNDMVRRIYDALFELNVECDFVYPDEENLSRYQILFVPALYSAPKDTLERLRVYAEEGGCLFVTCKSGFTDENVKVWADDQPYGLTECLGVTYDEFTTPVQVGIGSSGYQAERFMELTRVVDAEAIAYYDHEEWGKYAAVTRKAYGKGTAWYIGCMAPIDYLKGLFRRILKELGLWGTAQEAPLGVAIRGGYGQEGKRVTYYLNYTGRAQQVKALQAGNELLSGKEVQENGKLELPKWGVAIVESAAK